jgi:hypothetical protein
MVSKMALDDIEALREEGIEVTPEEIIRLNAFGLKVERNTDSSEYNVMPRVSILGDVVFYEPTIGSEIWFNNVSKVFDLDDHQTYFQLRTYSLSQKQDELVSPLDKEIVKQEVQKLFSEKLSKYTIVQVHNAISYVLFGNDPSDMERRAVSVVEKEKKDSHSKDENYCYEVGLLREGVLYKLGSPEEIKKMTVSEVELLIEYKLYMKFGSEKNKSTHTKNLAEYYGVLDEIRSAHA